MTKFWEYQCKIFSLFISELNSSLLGIACVGTSSSASPVIKITGYGKLGKRLWKALIAELQT
jgi:hypothetical protein